jgi:dTDP-4-dehydrorhamnose reductase
VRGCMTKRVPAMADSRLTVLVLGATGMLGHTVLRVLAGSGHIDAWGAIRAGSPAALPAPVRKQVICGVDAESGDALAQAIATARPQAVINCVGVVKQLAAAEDPLAALPLNSMLPHRLARLCKLAGARLVHISTDCVFLGTKGLYSEDDPADARDLYGLSKYLGEVDYPNAITVRTSIIGPELRGAHGLVGWFLAQSGPVKGFTHAIFSGLSTVELAKVIRDYILPREELRGVHHVSAAPISKYDLLRLVAQTYQRDTQIVPVSEPVIDRSLDSSRFRGLTGYSPPAWPDLVRGMYEFG